MEDYQTEAEVRMIVSGMLKDERAHSDKLHEQNTQKFDTLFASVNQVKGGGAVLGFVLITLQIIKMVTGK